MRPAQEPMTDAAAADKEAAAAEIEEIPAAAASETDATKILLLKRWHPFRYHLFKIIPSAIQHDLLLSLLLPVNYSFYPVSAEVCLIHHLYTVPFNIKNIPSAVQCIINSIC